MTFNTLGFSKPILRAVQEQGYSTPTPIQMQAAPIILQGQDLMASAQTGTGKTAGFTLPILQRLSKGARAGNNQARVLVVTPTRELAAQIQDNVFKYGKYLDLSSTVVFGGVKINPQMKALRRGVDILVATPGRLLDLYQQNAVKFDQLETLVLDEADRMLDMGFIHDVKRIQAILPKQKQTLLFSATLSNEVRRFASSMLNNPQQVDVSPEQLTVDKVEQRIHPVDKSRKTKLLSHLIVDKNWSQVLVFSRTKHGANRLVKALYASGIAAAAIHGNKSQAQRTKALSAFKQGKVDILVATDIAARGIDIASLPHVVNFDLPNVPEDYVHRIGRTGRAGSGGQAVSLVSADEVKQLRDIERLLKTNLIREEVEGFEPSHVVPASQPVGKRQDAPKKSSKGSNVSRLRTGNSRSGNKGTGGGQQKRTRRVWGNR